MRNKFNESRRSLESVRDTDSLDRPVTCESSVAKIYTHPTVLIKLTLKPPSANRSKIHVLPTPADRKHKRPHQSAPGESEKRNLAKQHATLPNTFAMLLATGVI